MASNLPPGVSESMLPGNRPEDLEYEALYEKVYDDVTALDIGVTDDSDMDRLVSYIADKITERKHGNG